MVGSIRSMRKMPAFLLPLILATASFTSLEGQRRLSENSPLDTIGKNPSQELGWEILERFRSMSWSGGYKWRIQLMISPRREKTRYVNGVMFGDHLNGSPVSRIDIFEQPAEVDTNGKVDPAQVLRLLFQSGRGGYAMLKRSGEMGPPEILDSSSLFENIAGSNFTLFDLMAPFVYWPRFRYEGRTTFRGSPTHLFWMYPPEDDNFLRERVSGVRLFVNDQFNVLFQTEIYGIDGKKQKTIYISGVEKVDGQVIIKELDLRNEVTRDKTRLKVVEAEMGLALPASLFEPQSLMENLQQMEIDISKNAVFEPVQ